MLRRRIHMSSWARRSVEEAGIGKLRTAVYRSLLARPIIFHSFARVGFQRVLERKKDLPTRREQGAVFYSVNGNGHQAVLVNEADALTVRSPFWVEYPGLIAV